VALLAESDVLEWVPQAKGNIALAVSAARQAQALADAYVGYALESAERETMFDVDAGTAQLVLPAFPVTVIAEIAENAGTVTVPVYAALAEDTEFAANARSGVLTRLGRTWKAGRRAVRAQYTAGWTEQTVQTETLYTALLELTGWRLGYRGDAGTTQDSTDGYTRTKEQLKRGVPQSIATMLEPYRRLTT